MINLLPYEKTKQLKAARANGILYRYIIVMIFSAIFLASGIYGVYLTSSSIKTSADKSSQSTEAQNSDSTILQKKAEALQTKINDAKTIMDSEIKYSDVLIGIAKALPSGIVIDKIALTNSSFITPFKLTALATNVDVAGTLKDKLSASQLFTGVSLISTTRISQPTFAEYPISVELNVTLNKGVSL